MSGRQVFLASSVPLSKRFAKLEKAPQRSGGGGSGAKKSGVKAASTAGAPARKRQDKARQTASKSREFAAASKRGLDGAPMKAAKAVKQQEKKSKNAAAAAGGAGRAGKKGEQSKVARLTGKKTPGTIKTKKPGKGKDAARKGDAKPLSKEDLEYELDRYRHEAGRGPNPDAARLDAELEAYRTAKAAAAAASSGEAAAAPAAMEGDAAGSA